ncbi:MAG: phenylalanine--tRNA ligase beta subunit-related protein [Pseudomonadota bacterium]
MNFEIDQNVKKLGIQVVFLVLHNINNDINDPKHNNVISDYHDLLLQNKTYESISRHPHLVGYHDLHDSINMRNKRLLSSPQSMFRVLFEKRKLTSINFLVDSYNYVSMKHHISIGAHDLEEIEGNVNLNLSSGNELFVPLGAKKSETISQGEYCYFDDTEEVICRLECKQCNRTKISKNSNSALVIFQGNKNIELDLLLIAVKELIEFINQYNDEPLDYSMDIR